MQVVQKYHLYLSTLTLRKTIFIMLSMQLLRPKAVFLFIALFSTALSAQTGCPGCTLQLPPLQEDTIYISPIPNGVVGSVYDHDLSFRVPKTTNPVHSIDPTTPAGLTISSFTITSLENVPPGLSWEASQLSFNPAVQTDGCIKFCGTPLVSDSFHIIVNVDVQVSIISQASSFILDMYIEPISASNDGFSFVNFTGCGQTTVNFLNNIPSNGNSGYSYYWDFGNGAFSLNENPPDQLYNSPGIYPVTYQATIDTFGYFLTSVSVNSVSCNDINFPPANKPDVYIRLKNPAGDIIYTSSTISNASTPVSFNLNQKLTDEGSYILDVFDQDGGIEGDDDFCGSIVFTRTDNGTYTSGDLTATLNIVHPLITVNSADTVTVYELPAIPEISSVGTTFCQNDSIQLSSSYPDGNSWFKDGQQIIGANNPSLFTNESGVYTVNYISPEGCIVTSNPVNISAIPIPEQPVFGNTNNLLSLFDPNILPDQYQLQWFQNGQILPGDTSQYYCISEFGLYTLELTDLTTGCHNSFSSAVAYNPGVECFSSISEPLEGQEWVAFPNPGNGLYTLQYKGHYSGEVTIRMMDLFGRIILNQQSTTDTNISVDIRQYPAGNYILEIISGGKTFSSKMIKW